MKNALFWFWLVLFTVHFNTSVHAHTIGTDVFAFSIVSFHSLSAFGRVSEWKTITMSIWVSELKALATWGLSGLCPALVELTGFWTDSKGTAVHTFVWFFWLTTCWRKNYCKSGFHLPFSLPPSPVHTSSQTLPIHTLRQFRPRLERLSAPLVRSEIPRL